MSPQPHPDRLWNMPAAARRPVARVGDNGAMSGTPRAVSSDLDGCQVFTLRPAGQARSLLTRLRGHGAAAGNLPLLRLRAAAAAPALATLAQAGLDAGWLFTSPASVRFSGALAPAALAADGPVAAAARRGQVFAPGRGTAQALGDLGIAPVAIPENRFDSEGLLALPALAPPLHGELLLVGAPGGRDLLREELGRRGLRVTALTVYERVPALVPARHWHIDQSPGRRLALIVTSAAMLDRLCETAPATELGRLQAHALVVVSSERLRERALALGFRCSVRAASPSDTDLVDALRAHRHGERADWPTSATD